MTMLGIILLSVFSTIIVLIIGLEIRNERRYQEKRRQKREKKETLNVNEVSKGQIEQPPKEIKREETVQKESSKETKKLPKCNYPLFTHSRLLEMGLSDDEAQEFVQELVPQLEAQIPLIEEAYENKDFHQMERLTHSIKGSTTNLGTGGVSDLLVECNTYLKTGTDIDIARTYIDSLKHYTQTLKEQYR